MGDHEDLVQNLITARVQPFRYDYENKEFVIGDERLPLQDFPEKTYGFALQRYAEPAEVEQMLAETPLVHAVREAIMLPRMAQWLVNNDATDLLDETGDVMRETYHEFKGSAATDHYAAAAFMDDEPPYLFLQTVGGQCECLKVTNESIFAHTHYQEQVIGFEYHNVFTVAQKASLLAGLGHIATRIVQ